MPSSGPPAPTRFGRYAVGAWLASGGTATVHLGRLLGEAGFSRVVALKRSHPQLAADPEFTAMLIDEARLAARVRHPNVVPVLDVVHTAGELGLVLEYVHGESLSRLLHLGSQRGERPPAEIAVTILASVLHGLHAAHEARDEAGNPLAIVHRDVSPQNVLVGADGVARVLDFGIAKALGRAQQTREGHVKGKLGYMPPEQLRGEAVDRRADVYSAAVVLWESLTGERLFTSDSEGATITRVLTAAVDPPSARAPEVPPALDAIVLRGLAAAPDERFSTAREMALALEEVAGVEPASIVGAWVEDLAAASLAKRATLVAEAERLTADAPAAAGASSEEPTDLTTTAATRPRRGARIGAGIAAIALAATAFVGWQTFHRADAGTEPTAPAASAPATPPAVATASEPGPASAAAAAAPKTAAPEAPASDAPAKPARPAAARARHAPPAKGGERCYPAFYVDGQGKHFYPPCAR